MKNVCLCQGIGDVLDSTVSAEKKSFSVESRYTLQNLDVQLNICFFAWGTEHLCEIRYSHKDLPILP